MDYAIIQLRISAEICENNSAINRKEGNNEQADLETRSAESFRKAIEVLSKK